MRLLTRLRQIRIGSNISSSRYLKADKDMIIDHIEQMGSIESANQNVYEMVCESIAAFDVNMEPYRRFTEFAKINERPIQMRSKGHKIQ